MSRINCDADADGIVRMEEGLTREQCAPSVALPVASVCYPIPLPEVTKTSGFLLMGAKGREVMPP